MSGQTELKCDDDNGPSITGGYTRFRRADLQKVLCSDMRGELHLSHRLVYYEELPHEVVLHFQDGKTATCDLLIGADGIRSAVRRQFLSKQEPSPLSSDAVFWSGEYAYRGLVEVERLQAAFPGHRACDEPVIVRQMIDVYQPTDFVDHSILGNIKLVSPWSVGTLWLLTLNSSILLLTGYRSPTW